MIAAAILPFIIVGVIASILVTILVMLMFGYAFFTNLNFARWTMFITCGCMLFYRWING